MGNKTQSKWFVFLLHAFFVGSVGATAAFWVESDWGKVSVGVAGVVALCASIYGGAWRFLLLGAVAGAWWAFLATGVPNAIHSPGIIGIAGMGAAGGAFLLVGLGLSGTGMGRVACWWLFALWAGASAAIFAAPRGEGISQSDISENWDGLIVSNRHLLALRADGHDSWSLEMPGGGSSPWSIGHALILSDRTSPCQVIEPGASFLPIWRGGERIPFWVYLGGGGEGITPAAAMRTVGLMGKTGT